MSMQISHRATDLAKNLEVPQEALRDFCVRHHIRRLSFFGSVLRDDFSEESDVDVLVEYTPGHVPGFALVTHEDELSAILGRQVDLKTRNSLNRYYREKVLAAAETVYVRT